MREIKFRAWDKTVGKSRVIYVTWKWIAERESHLSDYELMQLTGLKDKNGKEIYEGDLVQWNTGRYLCIAEMKDGCWKVGRTILGHLNNVEVIGNIWENPDLFV